MRPRPQGQEVSESEKWSESPARPRLTHNTSIEMFKAIIQKSEQQSYSGSQGGHKRKRWKAGSVRGRTTLHCPLCKLAVSGRGQLVLAASLPLSFRYMRTSLRKSFDFFYVRSCWQKSLHGLFRFVRSLCGREMKRTGRVEILSRTSNKSGARTNFAKHRPFYEFQHKAWLSAHLSALTGAFSAV